MKLANGETWTAKLADSALPALQEGDYVIVTAIHGSTAIVAPTERESALECCRRGNSGDPHPVCGDPCDRHDLPLPASCRRRRAGIVERLGEVPQDAFAGPQLILVPFVDRMRPLIDMREQVVSVPTAAGSSRKDNLVVSIDTVVYFQVTDARARSLRDPQLSRCCRTVDHDNTSVTLSVG